MWMKIDQWANAWAQPKMEFFILNTKFNRENERDYPGQSFEKAYP